MARFGLVVAIAALAACEGGVSSGGGGGGGAVDAKQEAGSDGGIHWIDAAAGSGSNLPCENMATPPGDGHHNPGQDCQKGCHDHGFTVCGTLYANPTQNIAFSGAHVTLTDSNNQVIDLVTMTNGNFYTTQTVAFPVKILASSCPSAVAMTETASSGRCNQSGCHPGLTSMQMHLP